MGTVDQASDTLLVNPAQFRATSAVTGTLRRYRQLVLEITHVDPNVVDATTLADTLLPVLVGPTVTVEGGSSLQIRTQASDLEGTQAPTLRAAYTLDGTTWNTVDLVLSQEIYSAVVPLGSGSSTRVTAIITAQDAAGNSASETVGVSTASPWMTYLPFLWR